MTLYEIEYSKRRKTLGIFVERDKRIIVRAPEGFPASKIEKIVASKTAWIEKKLNDERKYPDQPQRKEFVSGESMMLLGHHHKLYVRDADFDGIQFDGVSFEIAKASQSNANALFTEWYKKYALTVIEPIARNYARRLGVCYHNCQISDHMKYRWASCTPKGNINFNWRVIKAPKFVIEYLIAHELAHLRIGNHSAEFWNIVSIQVPKFEEAKDWLRANGNLLEVDF